MRHCCFRDSLEVLHDRIRYDSVDLIYHTPPFYSKGDYNRLYRTAKGHHCDKPVLSRGRVTMAAFAVHFIEMEAIRILLIEPDRHARDLLRLLVEAAYEGVIITTARNSADGMEMLQETHYDIVICDNSPVAPSIKELCDAADCSLVLMTRPPRPKPSELEALPPNLPAQSLLYKPMMFRDFCQNLHKAVLLARSRQAKISRRRSGRVLPPRGN